MLWLMTAVVLGASLILASRLYTESASEAFVAGLTMVFGVTHGGISLLGWTGQLTLTNLVLLSTALSVALGLAGGRVGIASLRRHLQTAGAALVRSWREARRGRLSFATLGVVFVCGLGLWTAWVSWLAPSGSWDGLWYHEPMVGWAIQERGFAVMDVPPALEWVNGYPRACENLMLWATLLSDRRLIDVIPSVMWLTSLAAFVVLASHFGVRRSVAAGVGVGLLTIPGAVLQLRSTYVDLTVLAAGLLALVFVFRPVVRAPDVWLAAVACACFACTKSNSIVFAGMMFLTLGTRVLLLRNPRQAANWFAALLAFGVAAAPTYVRNVLMHSNPFWPLRIHSATLGITLEGTSDLQSMQLGPDAVFTEFFEVPTPGQDYHDTRKHAYGYGLTFFGIPLLLASLLALGRSTLLPRWSPSGEAALGEPVHFRLVALLGLGVFMFVASPAYYWARYSLVSIGIALVVIAWWLRGKERLADGFVGAVFALNIVTLYWAVPAWDVTVSQALELSALPSAERVLADTSHCLWTADARRWREENVDASTTVVATFEAPFVGNAWNEAMSNRVVLIDESDESFVEGLARVGGSVAYVPMRGSAEQALVARGWRVVMAATPEYNLLERAPAP